MEGNIDLTSLVAQIADRDSRRSEANLQSDLHTFLLAAPLALREHDLEDQKITLEKQAGERRRIDVEVGFCVFEAKRDLRIGKTRIKAEDQLAGYVHARTETMGQRYAGVLTDGAEWHLYSLESEGLKHVSQFYVDSDQPDVEGLTIWLESVLTTAKSITPTPSQIELRLGARSAGHALDFAELGELYRSNQDLPTVKLKRELWARLLTTAYGTGFVDSDDLFIEHTLLVITAEVIAHCVLGLDPTAQDISAEAIVTGELFASADVHGVVEADFFDWPIEVPGGSNFVKSLARRLSRFVWRDVEHDVLKTLYESIISSEQRKRLGEYYTPDWLADRVVNATVSDPLAQRALDPACGSGTFIFHAVRQYLTAAAKAKVKDDTALEKLTQNVIGMDIHPVAVTFARVTYLLAIGPTRLQAEDRPPLSIPIYLGDSIQWGQEQSLFTADALIIPTGAATLTARELKFPRNTLANAGQFDRLVVDLSDLAKRPRRRSRLPSLSPIYKRYGIGPGDQEVIQETFATLCDLHDTGRNHIWGYYVRNLARPVWLSRPENRVDVLIGNPPWLAYRFMTPEMQREFRKLSEERGLWAGASVATHQDLSSLFVLRTVERYLKDQGSFGLVMPWSTLRSRQFRGFRGGSYANDLRVDFDRAWDLHSVKPSFFPVPACVIFGGRSQKAKALTPAVEKWSGKLPDTNVAWAKASQLIKREQGQVKRAGSTTGEKQHESAQSEYHARFTQGATLVPRVLFSVKRRPAGTLGTSAGRVPVESRRSRNEKQPWKSVETLKGTVERQFVRGMHLGETLLPYRLLRPLSVVLPCSRQRMLGSEEEDLASYPGLFDWWSKAERLWTKHSSNRLTLREQIDFQQKLSLQVPPAPFRVVYNKSGMYLTAAIAEDSSIIDHTLYWGACTALEEARYLEAILNSDALTQALRPLQARGEHNPRHYDKYVWKAPVPSYEESDKRHARLVALASEAEAIVTKIELPQDKSFQSNRRIIREVILDSDVGREIETVVRAILGLES